MEGCLEDIPPPCQSTARANGVVKCCHAILGERNVDALPELTRVKTTSGGQTCGNQQR
jgi:hypothetical protein